MNYFGFTIQQKSYAFETKLPNNCWLAFLLYYITSILQYLPTMSYGSKDFNGLKRLTFQYNSPNENNRHHKSRAISAYVDDALFTSAIFRKNAHGMSLKLVS